MVPSPQNLPSQTNSSVVLIRNSSDPQVRGKLQQRPWLLEKSCPCFSSQAGAMSLVRGCIKTFVITSFLLLVAAGSSPGLFSTSTSLRGIRDDIVSCGGCGSLSAMMVGVPACRSRSFSSSSQLYFALLNTYDHINSWLRGMCDPQNPAYFSDGLPPALRASVPPFLGLLANFSFT